MRALRIGEKPSQAVDELVGLLDRHGYFDGNKARGLKKLPLEFNGLVFDAVKRFQRDAKLLVDGVVGVQTWEALRGWKKVGASNVKMLPRCSEEEVRKFGDLVDLLTEGAFSSIAEGKVWDPKTCKIGYGPGHGVFVDGAEKKWVVTAGTVLGKNPEQQDGKWRHTFHCSSLGNFVMGVLTCANEQYTHFGNIPPWDQMCTEETVLYKINGPSPTKVHGYGANCFRLTEPHESASESGDDFKNPKYIGLLDVFYMRKEARLMTFCQSTHTGKGWKMGHHVGFFWYDARYPDKMFRFAADGSRKSKGKYSGTVLDVECLDLKACESKDPKLVYEVFRLHGIYPFNVKAWPVEFEAKP